MPKANFRSNKKTPKGFSEIEPTLKEFQEQLNLVQREETTSHSKKKETLWPIFRINHQRSRYIYDLYYEKKLISQDLYKYLIKNRYADGALILKWKKQGYEHLCCLSCITTKETSHGGTCICRVPKGSFKSGGEDSEKKLKEMQCVTCGCRGCASSD